jgi:phospholipase D1/2
MAHGSGEPVARYDEEPAPMRPLGQFEPLLMASNCYPALEREALAAKQSISLWFRIFDPQTGLVSAEAQEAGCKTWADLLAHRADDGVDIRIAMADFDPLGATALHATAHANARALAALAERPNVSLLVAGHGARASTFWRWLSWPMAMRKVEQARRGLNAGPDPSARLEERPGLKRWLKVRDGRLVWRRALLPELMPATHHQKIAVFDDRRAIIGGLDVDPRRWDDPDHRRPAPQTWRDVSVTVDGDVATDIARHLAQCWNYEVRRLDLDAVPILPVPPRPASASGGGPAIRLCRTVSLGYHCAKPGLAPRKLVREIERDHIDLIGNARTLIYCETQFLRSTPIIRALVRQAKAQPQLGLIVVLPAAPDDVAFEHASGLGPRYGELLQAKAVRRLERAFGKRLALISPARNQRRRKQDRSVRAGAGIIYVHAKVLIVDDAAAMVTSANLNGRSLRWDTEAGVTLTAPAQAAALRQSLFRSLLPDPPPPATLDPLEAPAAWQSLAENNLRRPPGEREGLILPYHVGPAEEMGTPVPAMPEEMV